MDMYHRANPGIRIWYQSIQEELQMTRTLTNLLGRKHKFLDRWGDSLFRSAYAYKPQSTIGDLLNTALRALYNEQLSIDWDLTILLQLHDAIYVLVKDEDVKKAIRLLRKCMMIPLTYRNETFFVDCDFKVKTSWYDGVDVEVNWKDDYGQHISYAGEV
jgi:DNA polymerase I-like protein with 3'-5' exonuclease and polymerase domains